MRSNVINVPPGGYLPLEGSGATPGARQWALLLADWTRSSACRELSPCERQGQAAGSVLASTAALFLSPSGRGEVTGEGAPTAVTEQGVLLSDY